MMAENTKIEWCDHTFNPWRGCQKVAPGCANCYAETMSKRNPGTLGIWGPNGTRVVASEAMWRKPLDWNAAAKIAGTRPRVFCASLADVFEEWQGGVKDAQGRSLHDAKAWGQSGEWIGVANMLIGKSLIRLDDVRARLFRLIDATPNLDWLLLTKRPENVRRMWPAYQNDGNGTRDYSPRVDGVMHGGLRMDNVWLGTSVANQEDASRNIPELLNCRDLAAKVFLSVEPLIGPAMLTNWMDEAGVFHHSQGVDVDWVIVGGESGHHARPCNVDWIRSIVRQCKEVGVPCFVKQLGTMPLARCPACYGRSSPIQVTEVGGTTFSANVCPGGCRDGVVRAPIRDRKGGDPFEWPKDLRVREFPTEASHVL